MSLFRYAPNKVATGGHHHKEQVVRAFEAGPEGLEIIAVGGRKPEGGDGVHNPDRWPPR